MKIRKLNRPDFLGIRETHMRRKREFIVADCRADAFQKQLETAGLGLLGRSLLRARIVLAQGALERADRRVQASTFARLVVTP